MNGVSLTNCPLTSGHAGIFVTFSLKINILISFQAVNNHAQKCHGLPFYRITLQDDRIEWRRDTLLIAKFDALVIDVLQK